MADDFWFGSPGTTNVIQTRGTAPVRPPGYGFAQWLSRMLPQIMNSPFPQYQGTLDPGLSPTMMDTIRRAQGYAQSSPPEILSGVQGALGRFMSPRQINPWSALFGGGNGSMGGSGNFGSMYGANAPSMFGGANDYFGVNPSQRVWGGRPAGDFTWQAGMPQAQPSVQAQPQAQPQGNDLTAMTVNW